MREAILAQVEALRAQALLLASQADAVLKTLEAVFPPPVPEEPEEAPDGRCLHPVADRVPAATAGQPSRYACRRCKQWGGLKESQE